MDVKKEPKSQLPAPPEPLATAGREAMPSKHPKVAKSWEAPPSKHPKVAKSWEAPPSKHPKVAKWRSSPHTPGTATVTSGRLASRGSIFSPLLRSDQFQTLSKHAWTSKENQKDSFQRRQSRLPLWGGRRCPLTGGCCLPPHGGRMRHPKVAKLWSREAPDYHIFASSATSNEFGTQPPHGAPRMGAAKGVGKTQNFRVYLLAP